MAKKNFKSNNPALEMISKTQEQEEPIKEQSNIEDYIPAVDEPLFNTKNLEELAEEETRSKRLQSLITPSTHKALKQLSKKYKTSVNELVNRALEEFTERTR